MTPSARFDDLRGGAALAFPPPADVLVARAHDEVRGVLEGVEARTAAGAWAWGFLAYEAGAGLDPGLPRVDPPPGTPLAWFGVGDGPDAVTPVDAPSCHPATGPWRPDRDPAAHRRDVAAVRAHIAAGETYQANLTVPWRAPAPDDPFGVYAAMAAEQQGAHHAYLDLGELVIASASPELFVEVTGDTVRMRPMKGTAARGLTTAEDRRVHARLRADPKERAENIMIVDLVRNDLGRIALPGSVRAGPLCAAERYGTVWQLTSDVTATLRPGIGWPELFTALFPCGSITGAPKQRSMEILADLEPAPRGVYCGVIGWIAPPSVTGPRARFAVAIRTMVVDRAAGEAVYGVGGGITWSSDPDAEHAELLTKGRILHRRTRPAGLLETFAHLHGCSRHLDRHLARMLDSAAYFGFPVDEHALRAAVASATRPVRDARVRVRLGADGEVDVTLSEPPGPACEPVRLALDDHPLDADAVARRHKTVHREPYDDARARHPDADDAILVNRRGELVETSIATLAVRLDGTWCTPPVESGALPGVERARRIEAGELHERTLWPADLDRADAIAVLSSLRGWRPARVTAPDRP